MSLPTNIPVIASIGEFTHKPKNVSDGKEPVDLMAEAMRAAIRDCGQDILSQLDTVSVLGVVSWLYKNPASLLCNKLDISPKHQIKAGMGGEKSTKLIHEAALAIQKGDKKAVAIVGGESNNAFKKARREKTRLDWTERSSREEAWGDLIDATLGVSRESSSLGVQRPIHIYPFFENAYSEAAGQTPTESVQQSAILWETFSKESQHNPYAWQQGPISARDIATVNEHNRMISFPYSKLMVANDSVNQAAAVIVTSFELAIQMGIPEKNLIYFVGGAAADEKTDFLERGRYDYYPAMTAVLEAASSTVGGASNLDYSELYSCFPIVPKAAQQILFKLGMSPNIMPSVTGGLTFFGGPLNNYMTHACCAMVRALRKENTANGLLYGQGGVMTKNHALILSSASNGNTLSEDYSVQETAQMLSTPPPKVLTEYEGEAIIETYSAYYGRDNEPVKGIVIARNKTGERIIAEVPYDDEEAILALTDYENNAIGTHGNVRIDSSGRLIWGLK